MSSFDRRTLGLCYATTVLVSAFLVFQVQPVISKFILPWFGGTPAVWTTCMLFFQVVLFGGYAYAHLSTRLLRPTTQGLVHLGLIALALVLLPISPGAAWKPVDAHHPTWRILCLLAANVGAPYFLLSSTGPLIQAWFARTEPSRSPYRLYALSNIGSLVALLSYPFVVEPLLPTTDQSRFWSLGFGVFALLCGYCAWRVWRLGGLSTVPPAAVTTPSSPTSAEAAPSIGEQLVWLGLAACPSLMLLATTNHVCQDVAVVPFLWVVPLAIYLVSFIVCFEKEAWYSGRWCGLGAAASIVAVSLTTVFRGGVHVIVEAGVYFLALFFVCMLCHGELVRRKPASRHLTAFYLACSAGGALGGICVALISPLVFSSYFELNLGFLASYILALLALFTGGNRGWLRTHSWRQFAAGAAAFLGLLIVVRSQAGAVVTNVVDVSRNFYGVLCVDELDADQPELHRRVIRHGRIQHGLQYLAEGKRRQPTIYYGETTGVGLTLRNHPRQQGRRIGVVGLGAGVLAAYGKPGDTFRFYEINPEVLRVAQEHFTFLSDCPARVDVILGDARLSLEREQPQDFDILVLDAFSGDAIPSHLLTREAMQIYRRHLRPGGVIALHISNRHVDLAPVVRALANDSGLEYRRLDSEVEVSPGETAVYSWVVLTDNHELLATPAIAAATVVEPAPRSLLWTDDASNLFEVLK